MPSKLKQSKIKQDKIKHPRLFLLANFSVAYITRITDLLDVGFPPNTMQINFHG